MLHANLATESISITSKNTSTTSTDSMFPDERRESVTSTTSSCNYEVDLSAPAKTERSKCNSSHGMQSGPTSTERRRFSSPSIEALEERTPQGLRRTASAACLGTVSFLSSLEDKKVKNRVTEKEVNWRKSFRQSLCGLDSTCF